MNPTPHASPALRQLRVYVSLAALAVGLSAGAHLLVFGFVRFTQVRWTEIVQEGGELSVVAAPDGSPARDVASGRSSEAHTPSGARGTAGWTGKAAADAARLESAAPARVELVLGRWDRVLREFCNLATTAGVIGSVSLGLLVVLGVVIAGGGAVPGVEKTVNAAVWAVALMALALPWRDVLPSVPFSGIFVGYRELVATCEPTPKASASPLEIYATHLVMPLVAIAVASVIALRFREGVERGIIVTSVNELDEELDREMARIRSRGVTSNVGARSVGALNQAIGAPLAAPPAPPPIAERPTADGTLPPRAAPVRGAESSRLRLRDPAANDDPGRRPI